MRIVAPNKQYNDISAGIRFVNGIAETDDEELIAWFLEHGYSTEENKINTRKKE